MVAPGISLISRSIGSVARLASRTMRSDIAPIVVSITLIRSVIACLLPAIAGISSIIEAWVPTNAL